MLPRIRSKLLQSSAFMVAISALFLNGCSSDKQYANPLAVQTDPKTSSNSRKNAMQQAAISNPDDPQRIKSLKEIMTGRGGHPLDVRIEAFNLLLAHDREMALTTLFYRLPTIPSAELVDYLCKRIVDEKWVQMTPSLIRSLSTGNIYLDPLTRPDGQALLGLYPDQSLSDIVMSEVVKLGEGLVAPRWRMSAYELLNRIGPPQPRFHNWLSNPEELLPADEFHAALQKGYLELGVIPETVEELRWLETIGQPEYDDYWAQCVVIVNAVPPANKHDFGLRHLAVLTEVRRLHPAWLALSRAELYADLTKQISDRRHFYSGQVGGGGADPINPQRLRNWEAQLQWGDLLAIKLADQLIRDPAIRAQIFTLALQDRLDESTEYGGILDVDADLATELRAFPPARMANDTRYQASNAMVTRSYTAPFHFHFHVQEEMNRDYAGPGSGDRNYADIMRINGIVLTSIGATTLNVDYYQEGKISVDLGTISQ